MNFHLNLHFKKKYHLRKKLYFDTNMHKFTVTIFIVDDFSQKLYGFLKYIKTNCENSITIYVYPDITHNIHI